MAKVKITGHASGTGVVTVTAPNTSTDRTITLPDSTDTLIGSATTDALTTRVNGASGRKNMIINGAMNVAQRGTSYTGFTNGSGNGCKTVDRYLIVEAGAPSGVFTITQDTDAPVGFASSLKWDCTTAQASMAAADQIYFEQKIEAQDSQHLNYGTSSALQTTVSFWVKSNKTGTYVAWFYQQDDDREVQSQYTIDTADTWEKKTCVVPADTTGVIDNNNDTGLRVRFVLASGTNFTSGTASTAWEADVAANRNVGQTVNIADSTANYINITGVQFETGSVATDFEHRSYGEELALCQRYYQKSYGEGYYPGDIVSGVSFRTVATSSPYVYMPLASEMRGIPSITIYNGVTGATGTWRKSSSAEIAVSTSNVTTKSFVALANANATFIQAGHYTAESEL